MSTETLLSPEEEILKLHLDFIVANRTGDTAWCRANMAGGDEGAILFNTNGSNYIGVEHWCRLWDFYREHIKGDQRTGGEPPLFEGHNQRVTVNGDSAWVTYRLKMIGRIYGEPLPEDARGTEIYQKIDGEWKMVHGHWSIGSPGEVQGGV